MPCGQAGATNAVQMALSAATTNTDRLWLSIDHEPPYQPAWEKVLLDGGASSVETKKPSHAVLGRQDAIYQPKISDVSRQWKASKNDV
jgi:hypothetical protein